MLLTLAELRRKAEKKYLAALRTLLPGSADETPPAQALAFPLHIPCGKLTEAEVRGPWLATIKQLVDHAKTPGYELRQERINTRTSQAWQTVPREVVFASPADLFAFLGKTKEASRFQADVALITARLPQLGPWLGQHPQPVLDYHGKWESLLRVCEFFLAQARQPAEAPRYYLRELRIEGVHTKFIEQHTRPLRLLLDELLPPAALRYEEGKFLRRYGLREAEPLIRLRILDETLSAHLPFQLDDLAVPVSRFRELDLPCQTVLMVENLATFLSLPPLPATVAVWGKGFQVGVLAGAVWLQNRRLLYWGDLDVAGLQILHQLRAHFPQASTLLMDAPTLHRHAEHHSIVARTSSPETLVNLTPAEQELLEYLTVHNLRLEQEHIPYDELLTALTLYYQPSIRII